MWPNLQETADLVTFTEEILTGKSHFLCSVKTNVLQDFHICFSLPWKILYIWLIKNIYPAYENPFKFSYQHERPITKFYNGDDVNMITAELRLTKTRSTSFYKKRNLL